MEQQQQENLQSGDKKFKLGYLSLGAVIPPEILDQDQLQEFYKNILQNPIEKLAMICIEDWSDLSEEQQQSLDDPQNVITIQAVHNSEQSVYSNLNNFPSGFQFTKIQKKTQNKTKKKLLKKKNTANENQGETQQNKQQQEQTEAKPLEKLFESEVLISGGFYSNESENQQDVDYEISQNIFRVKLQQSDKQQQETYKEKWILNITQETKQEVVMENNEVLQQQEPQDFENPRIGHGQIIVDDQVYIFQGNHFEDYRVDGESYSLEYQDLKPIANCKYPRSRACYIKFINQDKNYVYAIGGFKQYNQNDQEVKFIEKYDISNDTWTVLETKKQLTMPGTGAWGFQHPQSKLVYLLGGIYQNSLVSNKIFRVQEENGKVKFVEVGKLKQARRSPKGAVVYNQKTKTYQIFVMGGDIQEGVLTIEHFEILNGEVVNHKLQDLSKLLENFVVQLQPSQFNDQQTFIIQ